MKFQFSVLNYYPSFMSEECITVGILFYNLNTGERYFEYTDNMKRIETFDDELNIDFLKAYLQGIKKEVTDIDMNYTKPFEFNMKNYIRFYVNEFKFTNINLMDNIKEEHLFIENTKKIYLKSDYDKKDRMTSNEEKKYIRDYLKSNNIPYSAKKIAGIYHDNIKYDYIIEDQNYAIKIFKFEGKSLRYMITSAKAWAHNALALKGIYKTIFIYDKTVNDPDYKIIEKILSEHSFGMMDIREGIEFLNSIDPNMKYDVESVRII